MSCATGSAAECCAVVPVDDPKLAIAADNLFECRYAAACAAVQAAAGLDSRTRMLGETARVDLRRRSLAFTADLHQRPPGKKQFNLM